MLNNAFLMLFFLKSAFNAKFNAGIKCDTLLVRESCSRNNVVEPVGKNCSSPRHGLRTRPREGVNRTPASIYMYQWIDRPTCLASRILSPKESFPGSEFKPASIWTCWMLIVRQMQSAFMPELHRWISKLTARHLQGPPGDLLITMVRDLRWFF